MIRLPDPQLLDVLAGYDRAVAGFGSGPKMNDMFCYIAAARSHVNLGFCRGALLSDPNRVLEGEGKTMRHIKFRSESDVKRPFVRRYIRAAIG
jgi:hypothetical protein